MEIAKNSDSSSNGVDAVIFSTNSVGKIRCNKTSSIDEVLKEF